MIETIEIEIGDTLIPKTHPVLKGKVKVINTFAGSDIYVLENGTWYTQDEVDVEKK